MIAQHIALRKIGSQLGAHQCLLRTTPTIMPANVASEARIHHIIQRTHDIFEIVRADESFLLAIRMNPIGQAKKMKKPNTNITRAKFLSLKFLLSWSNVTLVLLGIKNCCSVNRTTIPLSTNKKATYTGETTFMLTG